MTLAHTWKKQDHYSMAANWLDLPHPSNALGRFVSAQVPSVSTRCLQQGVAGDGTSIALACGLVVQDLIPPRYMGVNHVHIIALLVLFQAKGCWQGCLQQLCRARDSRHAVWPHIPLAAVRCGGGATSYLAPCLLHS